MASQELDSSVIQKRATAYAVDSVIRRAVGIAQQGAIGGKVVLVRDIEDQDETHASEEYQRFLDDHVLRFAQNAFIEFMVHGMVVVAVEKREVASGVAFAPVVVPCVECSFRFMWDEDVGGRIEIVRHAFRDARGLHLFQFGNYNYSTMTVDSKIGGLLHAYSEYFNLTTAAMSATVRAAKTPLVLQRGGNKFGGASGFNAPADMSLFNGITGEMDTDMTRAIQAIQEYEFKAQQRLLNLMSVQDAVMEQMRRNDVDPDDPTLMGGVSRVTLPDDTQVARVEYPALPHTPEMVYTRYTDIVFGIIGIASNTMTADKKLSTMQRFMLSKPATHSYIGDMNRLLRFVHALLVVESGGSYSDHSHTLAIPSPGVDFDDVLRVAALPQISPEDVRTLVEKALSVRLKGTPPEELAAKEAREQQAQQTGKPAAKKKKKQKQPENREKSEAGAAKKGASSDSGKSGDGREAAVGEVRKEASSAVGGKSEGGGGEKDGGSEKSDQAKSEAVSPTKNTKKDSKREKGAGDGKEAAKKEKKRKKKLKRSRPDSEGKDADGSHKDQPSEGKSGESATSGSDSESRTGSDGDSTERDNRKRRTTKPPKSSSGDDKGSSDTEESNQSSETDDDGDVPLADGRKRKKKSAKARQKQPDAPRG
jgi:hypothetical protein